jgi:hypothetical protein
LKPIINRETEKRHRKQTSVSKHYTHKDTFGGTNLIVTAISATEHAHATLHGVNLLLLNLGRGSSRGGSSTRSSGGGSTTSGGLGEELLNTTSLLNVRGIQSRVVRRDLVARGLDDGSKVVGRDLLGTIVAHKGGKASDHLGLSGTGSRKRHYLLNGV